MARRSVAYLQVGADEAQARLQRQELMRIAASKGWVLTHVYEEDADQPAAATDGPQMAAMLDDASRSAFDVVMAWDVAMLGRGLNGLVANIETLRTHGVDLCLHAQHLDTTGPAGGALYEMAGVFAQFARAKHGERVSAGHAAARGRGIAIGRPARVVDTERIYRMRKDGATIREIASAMSISVATAHRRVKKLFETS